MMHNKNITYSTGEFAAHFGIKKDTLLYYDKIGLFSPAGIKDNGYRYYTASQIAPFRTLLSFRGLNLSIKTLRDYFQDPSPAKLSAISAQQLERLKSEMEKLTQIQNHLTQISQSLQEALNAEYDKTQIRQLLPTYLICSKQMNDAQETSEQQWEETQDSFILNSDLSGITRIHSIITESDLKSGNFDRIHCLYTESSIPTEHLREGGTYAVYYHKGSYKNVKFAYRKMLSQIELLGYVPVGDAYEEYLIAETATKKEEDYVTKIMVRIQRI